MSESDPFLGGVHHLSRVCLHARFPSVVWFVVEQPADVEGRLRYEPTTNSFLPTLGRSLGYMRGFPGPYGWVGGLGTPPGRHCDAILATDVHVAAGDVVVGVVCGLFYRTDGDHKAILADPRYAGPDSRPEIHQLPPPLFDALTRYQSPMRESEGWRTRAEAMEYLTAFSNDVRPK